MMSHNILVVEDDSALAEAIADTLGLAGFRVTLAADGSAALEILEHTAVDMVLTDVQMRPMDGRTLLKHLHERFHDLPVLLMTAYGSVEQAVDVMKLGAIDYLAKPFEVESLLDKVNRYLPAKQAAAVAAMVAEDVRTRELMGLASRVADSEATVLILGESGTGKEVLARYIHTHSPRVDGPFVAINCAAIPENMLEAVLFGYEKGAYTGAHKASAGKFEQAQGGTLLLDEISEMSLPLQAKLLRVLQEREVERLGGRDIIQLDVRVLATSNRTLREEVAAGRFREDLFYRLNVFPLMLPPLRDRPRDIEPLVKFMIGRHLQGQPEPRLEAAALSKLQSHRWTGNVRELDNVVQRALILCDGEVIRSADVHFEAVTAGESSMSAASLPPQEEPAGGLSADMKSVEEQKILEALRSGNGSRKEAAEMLGISPRTLRYKLAKMRESGLALP